MPQPTNHPIRPGPARGEPVEPVKAPKVFGILAEFGDPADVYHAAEKIRDAGYKKWDVHSPFPIHGIESAMGLKDSLLGWIALFCALSGAFGGFGLQYWIHVNAYPLLIGGKPLNAYPAFVPVIFESGVLLTAFGCLLGMMVLNGLPRFYNAAFKIPNFRKSTDNGFFVSIEARDSRFNLETTRSFLQSIGGRNIEVLED